MDEYYNPTKENATTRIVTDPSFGFDTDPPTTSPEQTTTAYKESTTKGNRIGLTNNTSVTTQTSGSDRSSNSSKSFRINLRGIRRRTGVPEETVADDKLNLGQTNIIIAYRKRRRPRPQDRLKRVQPRSRNRGTTSNIYYRDLWLEFPDVYWVPPLVYQRPFPEEMYIPVYPIERYRIPVFPVERYRIPRQRERMLPPSFPVLIPYERRRSRINFNNV